MPSNPINLMPTGQAAPESDSRTRKTTEERLHALTERRERLAREIAALEARARTEARRRDNRRRFLLGAFLIHEVENNSRLRGYIATHLGAFLTRPEDHALFADLLASVPSLPDNPAAGKEDVA